MKIVHELKVDLSLTQTLYDRRPKEFPPKGYDSIEVDSPGCKKPDPIHTVKIDNGGQEIPLGNVAAGEDRGYYHWGPNYPEFICYKVRIFMSRVPCGFEIMNF